MKFYDRLLQETRDEQQQLQSIPSLIAALQGNVTKQSYLNFLEQAYHHVKHTVPILMSAGAQINPRQEALMRSMADYVTEEVGHDRWILQDIEACGGDANRVRDDEPSPACELFVSYIYDRIRRINPLCVFGMAHVLEGTSVALAEIAADRIKDSLQLPENAFHYLYSHGALDIDHVKTLEGVLNRIDHPKDQNDIIHTAKQAFILYGQIYAELEWWPLKQTSASVHNATA